jgi:hypothetical protein
MPAVEGDDSLDCAQLVQFVIQLSHFRVIEIVYAGGAEEKEWNPLGCLGVRKSGSECDDAGEERAALRKSAHHSGAARHAGREYAGGIDVEPALGILPHGLHRLCALTLRPVSGVI